MPKYVILCNWTDQGIRNVKDAPKRIEAAKALFQKAGGKIDIWYTMGAYDAVGFAELPSDEAYMEAALQLGSLGNIRTTTLKAWTGPEGQKVIGKLP